jgi:hypothetical protein
VFLDLGDPGDLVAPRGPHEQWQDHGLGLLRTVLHAEGLPTDVVSVRACRTWRRLGRCLRGYELLLMNVRSYTFGHARRAARIFKALQPGGLVLTGGMHASVATRQMVDEPAFDRICVGPGEAVIADLVRDPAAFPRVFRGKGDASMAAWPAIDRTLWPKPAGFALRRRYPWPLEPPCGWGPGPVATMLTTRTCPWHCVFCNENSYLPMMGRRTVEQVIEELNGLDRRHGPIGSVVFHDSLFFQSPSWLRRWLDLYPRLARKRWPYWAAARTDLVRRWPDLFEALLRETGWTVVSLGLESGSDRMLRMLNKECTAEDNRFAIDMVNRVGDALEARGREPPRVWANVMLGLPGETREDALLTMQMVRRIKRPMLSPAFYTPYPGAALGYQLIAEGKSLVSGENVDRAPGGEKLRGIDYGFCRELLDGGHADEIEALPVLPTPGPLKAPRARSRLYLFQAEGGRGKLAYGTSPADALDILAMRLDRAEMAAVRPNAFRVVSPRDLPGVVPRLG